MRVARCSTNGVFDAAEHALDGDGGVDEQEYGKEQLGAVRKSELVQKEAPVLMITLYVREPRHIEQVLSSRDGRDDR